MRILCQSPAQVRRTVVSGCENRGCRNRGRAIDLEVLNARIPAAGTRGIEPSLYVFIIRLATDFIVWQKKCCAIHTAPQQPQRLSRKKSLTKNEYRNEKIYLDHCRQYYSG